MLLVVHSADVIFFGVMLLLFFLVVVGSFFLTAWIRKRSVAVSPYSGFPLRRASDLPFESAKKILLFLYNKKEYDNRVFDIKKASFCRETGRIFQDSVSFFDTIHVDWNFLQKRHKGNYVSWGSLSLAQQMMIRENHDSLEEFQTEYSSPTPSPRGIEKEYALSKPGPLYVDIDTKMLLGWQIVPDTEFEVLIIQREKQAPIYPNIKNIT